MESFPHYLISPPFMKGHEMKLVTDEQLQIGDKIIACYNDNGAVYKPIVSIIEQREAKGNWKGLKKHPTFYHVKF